VFRLEYLVREAHCVKLIVAVHRMSIRKIKLSTRIQFKFHTSTHSKLAIPGSVRTRFWSMSWLCVFWTPNGSVFDPQPLTPCDSLIKMRLNELVDVERVLSAARKWKKHSLCFGLDSELRLQLRSTSLLRPSRLE
jgi:hypothetical protein